MFCKAIDSIISATLVDCEEERTAAAEERAINDRLWLASKKVRQAKAAGTEDADAAAIVEEISLQEVDKVPIGLLSVKDKLEAIPDISVNMQFFDDCTKLVFEVTRIEGDGATCKALVGTGIQTEIQTQEFSLSEIKVLQKLAVITREAHMIEARSNYHVHWFTCIKGLYPGQECKCRL